MDKMHPNLEALKVGSLGAPEGAVQALQPSNCTQQGIPSTAFSLENTASSFHRGSGFGWAMARCCCRFRG